ncbi:hypothetical protein FTUN_4497 [Frigoriglobus tundricola]|uniref:Uncharacterized protein n=1 Tax=Frigoriglobus tundricola TaxID=2774151 RepID=A0A6M5YS79_9BACT|nr:hypothetical protein FTUN_4497 [Frigoriglobus tundricola]
MCAGADQTGRLILISIGAPIGVRLLYPGPGGRGAVGAAPAQENANG